MCGLLFPVSAENMKMTEIRASSDIVKRKKIIKKKKILGVKYYLLSKH